MSNKVVTGLEYVQDYVQFLFPGTLFCEKTVRKISPGDHMTHRPGEIPEGCFGYQFFSRVLTELDNGKVHYGEAYDHSAKYYFGTVQTYDDIENLNEQTTDFDILLSNMRINNWDRVVKTTQGNYMPLEQGDVVLEPTTNKIIHKE